MIETQYYDLEGQLLRRNPSGAYEIFRPKTCSFESYRNIGRLSTNAQPVDIPAAMHLYLALVVDAGTVNRLQVGLEATVLEDSPDFVILTSTTFAKHRDWFKDHETADSLVIAWPMEDLGSVVSRIAGYEKLVPEEMIVVGTAKKPEAYFCSEGVGRPHRCFHVGPGSFRFAKVSDMNSVRRRHPLRIQIIRSD